MCLSLSYFRKFSLGFNTTTNIASSSSTRSTLSNMFIRLCSMVALFLLLTSAVSSMNIPATECKRDADCTVGNYCLFSMCETCLPCEQVFYRRSPITVNGRFGCARTADDCGMCLPGYQSEDLTGQRHSMKCYPTQSELPPADYLSDVNTIGATVTSIIICAILATLAAGSCFVYVKHRKVETTRPAVDNTKDESRNLVDRLPPPYEDPEEPADCVLASEPVYTRVIVQQDVLNQATPISYYHRHPKVESSDMDEDNANLPGAEPPIEDGNGSTETIPSLWEPNSVLDLHVDVPESNCPSTSTQLIRSQSLDLLTHHPQSHAVLTASRSDPTLPTDSRRRRSSGGESYAHRHVRLSMHRLPTTPVVPPADQNSFIDPAHNAPSRSTDQCQEDCEPTEPQAFVFDDSQVSASVSFENDLNLSTSILSFTGSLYGHQISSSTPTETGRGSQDSGFFDQSRRRPASDELSFGLALFVKRPREFE